MEKTVAHAPLVLPPALLDVAYPNALVRLTPETVAFGTDTDPASQLVVDAVALPVGLSVAPSLQFHQVALAVKFLADVGAQTAADLRQAADPNRANRLIFSFFLSAKPKNAPSFFLPAKRAICFFIEKYKFGNSR